MAVACAGRTNVPRPEGASALTGPAIVAAGAVSVPHLPKDRFALPTFDFGRFQTLLKDLAGNHVPVVVNIWASWCGPCRIESPNLVMAAERYGRQVQFLGVDIIDQRPAAQAFIKEEGYPYPSVFDPTGDIRDRLGFVGQPVTVFFDAEGKRYSQWSGPIDISQLMSRVRTLLP